MDFSNVGIFMKYDLNNLPALLTVKEASIILQRSPLTIKRWEAKGLIQVIRINSRGDRRFKKKEILRKLAELQIYQTREERNAHVTL